MRSTWYILKCDAGVGWRASVGPIVREMNMYYVESEERTILHAVKRRKYE